MTTVQVRRRAVALVAAYAIALNALLSLSADVKPTAADALHRVVCTTDAATRDGGTGTPDQHGGHCIAICAAMAGACGDGAAGRVGTVAAGLPVGRNLPAFDAPDTIRQAVVAGGYRPRAPPRV